MRKIRELLRLKFELGLSERKVAIALSISRSAVSECLSRAATAGLSWPLPEDCSDAHRVRRVPGGAFRMHHLVLDVGCSK